jgi:hypothetical protein
MTVEEEERGQSVCSVRLGWGRDPAVRNQLHYHHSFIDLFPTPLQGVTHATLHTSKHHDTRRDALWTPLAHLMSGCIWVKTIAKVMSHQWSDLSRGLIPF